MYAFARPRARTRFKSKTLKKTTESTAIYLIIAQYIAALCSRFSSFFHVFKIIVRARVESLHLRFVLNHPLLHHQARGHWHRPRPLPTDYDAPRRRPRTHGATRDWLHGDLQADTFMIVLQPTPATFRYSFDYITLGGYPHGLPPSTSSRNDEAGNMFYKGYSCVFSTTIPSSRLMVRVA